jgi:integral membrane sensor domain MASE1
MASSHALPARDWGSPAAVAGIFAAYLFLSLAMIFWSRHAVNVAEVWFANAMLVALLLRSVMQSLPLAMLLALLGSSIANVLMSAPWMPSLGIGIANMTEVAVAVIAARLLNLRLDRHPDDRFFLKGLISLVFIAPAAGALVGAYVVNTAFGTHWPHEFKKWWVGDAMGMLILAPPLIAYSESAWVASLRASLTSFALSLTMYPP